MHRYSCEVSLSLDACCRRLDIDEVDYIVESEFILAFPAEPNDEVYAVLKQYGFEKEATVDKLPMTWTFAFDHGTKTRDECTREELLIVVDHLMRELNASRDRERSWSTLISLRPR